MTWILLVPALVLLAAVGVLAGRRAWVMHVRPKSIQGSDLHMLRYCVAENTRAWGSVHFSLREGVDFHTAAAAVRENIRQHMLEPDNTFRLGVDLHTRRYVRHADRTADDIIDVVHDDVSFFGTRDDARNRELVFRFYPERRLIGLMFDHTVWDGVRFVNEIVVPMAQSRPFGSRWLLGDRYVPVVAELMQLYTIAALGVRWLRYRPMRTQARDADQKVVSHRFDLAVVREAKNRNGVKFTSALLGVWMQRLFRAMDARQDMVRVGVLVGMVTPRFRNNYTIVTVDVRRDDDLDRMIRRIERQLMARRFEVLPLYHLISFIEAQTFFKKHAIDYLFSPGFFHSHRGVSKQIDEMTFCAIPIGMPFYTFACSIDDEVTISTTVNTPLCDVEQLAEDATRVFDFPDGRTLRPRSEHGDGRVRPADDG